VAYATAAEVLARLGRYDGLIAPVNSPKHPNEDDVAAILVDVSAEVDLALSASGWDPATLDATAKAGLKDLASYGAISRILAGVPSDKDLDKLADYAGKVWMSALGDPAATEKTAIAGSLRAGSHPVIAALEAGRAGGGAGANAGDFWSDEPDYGTIGQIESELGTLTPSTAPWFRKGMTG
jgi:hypothetical protein